MAAAATASGSLQGPAEKSPSPSALNPLGTMKTPPPKGGTIDSIFQPLQGTNSHNKFSPLQEETMVDETSMVAGETSSVDVIGTVTVEQIEKHKTVDANQGQQRQENENQKKLPVPSAPDTCNTDLDHQNKKHDTQEVQSFGEPQVATDLLGKLSDYASGVVGSLISDPCQNSKEPSFVIDPSPPSIEPSNGPAPSTEDLKTEVRKLAGNKKAKPSASSMKSGAGSKKGKAHKNQPIKDFFKDLEKEKIASIGNEKVDDTLHPSSKGPGKASS
ncbi:hypothetical protein QJS10_CPA02g01101 [Acorus calamus]|uniref:Uncharacterized protein n=1 Tax=Acorus calamus TaxID=4465 RepID=A0AAV9FCI9_ACOCL|nr:hypothetical protein QJS10_CPA02g01101 [Acorus calamus]